MKSIAIITTCLTNGGAEKAAGLLSKHLSKKYNVYLFLIENKQITYEYGGEIINFSMNIKNNNINNSKLLFKKIRSKLLYFKTIKEIKRAKKKYHIDYSISFLEQINIMNFMSKVEDKIIVSVRNNRTLQNDGLRNKLENLYIRMMYNKAYKVVSLSYGITDDLIKHFHIKKEKIQTIYNFQNINEIKEKISKDQEWQKYEKIFKNANIIATMGRLTEQKNYINLLKIVKQIINERENTYLIIFGRGHLRQKIEDKIKELGIENNVFLFGYCENPFPAISKSTVFVMNSKYEGLCNAIIEAMICGTFIISRDCVAGPRELLSGEIDYSRKNKSIKICKRGILVPENDDQGMKKAIELAFDNEKLRKEKIYESKKYINSFSNEELLDRWTKLIEDSD